MIPIQSLSSSWGRCQRQAVLLAPLLIFLVAINTSARELTVHVAPNGNDAWTGANAEASSQSDGPKATLKAALEAVRKARTGSDGSDLGVQVLLRGGVYNLVEPVLFSPGDSGASSEKPLLISAYKNEKPILSGGRRIAGWKKVEGKPDLWSVEIPAVREGQWYFRQLFVNGERMIRARTPNEGFFRIQGESPQDRPVKLKYRPGDIKKEWAEDGDVEVVAFLSWGDLHMQIRQVDEANHVATLSGNPQESNKESNAQYYIENAPDALDMPGEWHLNRKTGVLAYWAKSGEDPNQAVVIAPKLTDLVRLQGNVAQKRAVQNIHFQGLSFAYTDWTLPDNGYADVQAAFGIRGDFSAEAATDCRITNCRFMHLGGYALELGQGCHRMKIDRNEMFDLAAGGLRVGEPSVSQDAFAQNDHHEVTDNHIHHLGEVYRPAIGVLILQSGNNRIAHNHIHDLYYTAISVGWNWGYQETPCHDNIIEFNHLHDIGKYLLSDMGAIYTLGIQEGTVIRNNLIHDVYSFTYGGWGIYPDEGSTHILIENNIVYRTKSAGFHQHYGKENTVRNNIFSFGKENQLMRSRAEAHLSFYFTNNIIYFDSGNLLGSNWSGDRFKIDNNIYFDARPGANSESLRFAGATLVEWRQRGHDVNSIITDPLFVDPQKYDFRLRDNSPALRMGFQPVDMSQVGVRKLAQ